MKLCKYARGVYHCVYMFERCVTGGAKAVGAMYEATLPDSGGSCFDTGTPGLCVIIRCRFVVWNCIDFCFLFQRIAFMPSRLGCLRTTRFTRWKDVAQKVGNNGITWCRWTKEETVTRHKMLSRTVLVNHYR